MLPSFAERHCHHSQHPESNSGFSVAMIPLPICSVRACRFGSIAILPGPALGDCCGGSGQGGLDSGTPAVPTPKRYEMLHRSHMGDPVNDLDSTLVYVPRHGEDRGQRWLWYPLQCCIVREVSGRHVPVLTG